MRIISFILLFIALFLEASITKVPLVFLIILNLTVFFRDKFIFFLAFLGGLILDSVLFKDLGLTSLFLITLVLLIFLYERKFEINTYYFVFFASFLGSLAFFILEKMSINIFIGALATSLISIVIYFLLKRFIVVNKSSSESLLYG